MSIYHMDYKIIFTMMQQVTEFFITLIGKQLALLRNRRKKFEHELSICAIFKDEARYLNEWLAFHRGVGVDHFYLYNNNSTDNFLEVLKPWLQQELVTLIDWPMIRGQRSAYRHCIINHRNQTRWVAFIDIDEFLFSPQSICLKEVLNRYNDVSAIFVYWVLFGSGGHVTRPDRGVLESYTRCMDMHSAINDTFGHNKRPGKDNYVTGWAQDGKSIVNPRLVRRYVVHKPKDMWYGEIVDENRCPPEQRVHGAAISHSIFRINHYWSRSIQEFTEKVEKRIAGFKTPPNVKLETWLDREKKLNVETDETILRTWREIQSQAER